MDHCHERALLPIRSINAFVFCPRLFWLEYQEGEWAPNHHTLQGTHTHKQVDQPGGKMSPPSEDSNTKTSKTPIPEEQTPQTEDQPWHTRSLWLSDQALGLSGKLDYVQELEAEVVMPVDTKKGRPPKGGGLWPADEVQLSLQALLLRAQGYIVPEIAIWYAGSRKRIRIAFTKELEEKAITFVEKTRQCAQSLCSPPPLEDAAQCAGCSLQPICLPDELLALQALQQTSKSEEATESPSSKGQEASIRRIQAPQDVLLPLYIQDAGTKIGVQKGSLKIRPREKKSGEKIPAQIVGLETISQLNLLGNVQITTQALQNCLRAEIPVSFFSTGGWFYGRAVGQQNRQIQVRIAQFEAFQTGSGLALARVLIADKISNCRTMIRRNGVDLSGCKEAVFQLKRLVALALEADSAEALLGIEGEAAKRYWCLYSQMLSREESSFAMKGRNRRPPRDASNAMLSYGYALLLKDCTIAASNVGLDVYLGMFHTPHHGNPALALDLMEPFRPLIVDSAILQLVRKGEVSPGDFVCSGQAVAMKTSAKKALLRAYERRVDELITHPLFGYQISYRRILSVQARLLSRVLLGEIRDMPSFRTR